MTSDDKRVLIAGGGPVGLFCALLLGRRGIPVRVFDVNPCLQDDPRAATTHPATLEILGAAGLAEDMARVGLVTPIFQFWDRPTGRLIAEFDHAVLAGETAYPYVVQCEQFKTARLILDRLEKMSNVEVLFNHEIISIDQDARSASVIARGPDGEKRHVGAWLVGADGGRSIVRKQSGIGFEGFTYDERFLVLTTPFDFKANRGYCERSYFADPEEWCNCFKVSANGPPGLWRTVYPADPNVSEESLMTDEAAQARLQRFFPSAKPYDIVHKNIYTINQRVASTFRKGRVLLAGDSAHLNNSIGGMGLNGGLQDADNLGDKLGRVVADGEPETLLDLYDLQRRTVTIEFTQAQTIANKKRLEAREPEARRRNFEELSAAAADPEKARAFVRRSGMLDMQRRANSITLENA
jgi:3-(3-hydroxy-phenyl)propionate hydroxylase